jgi:hypothetical protein
MRAPSLLLQFLKAVFTPLFIVDIGFQDWDGNIQTCDYKSREQTLLLVGASMQRCRFRKE